MKKINFDEVFKKYMAWIILLVVLFLFSFTKNFLSFANIVNILSQNSYAIICSLGVAFLMMAGEIDLSVVYHVFVFGHRGYTECSNGDPGCLKHPDHDRCWYAAEHVEQLLI